MQLLLQLLLGCLLYILSIGQRSERVIVQRDVTSMSMLTEVLTTGRKWIEERKRKKINRKKNLLKVEKVRAKLNELNNFAAEQLKDQVLSINQTFSFVNYSSVFPFTAKSARAGCSFLGAQCDTEAIEHDLVRNYITEGDSVLELGARFGTTSCEISHQLRNSGRLVAVEPDQSVWYLLAYNRFIHKCNFWIYRGVITDSLATNLSLLSASYDTRTLPITNSLTIPMQPSTLPSMNLQDIESKVHLIFSVLLIDCEGCLELLFSRCCANLTSKNSQQLMESTQYLQKSLVNIQTIILEADMSIRSPTCRSHCIDYRKWLYLFKLVGFQVVYQKRDPEFPDITHYVLKRNNK